VQHASLLPQSPLQNTLHNTSNEKCPLPVGTGIARSARLRLAPGGWRSAYFHVVFTLPSQIGRLALQNPKLIYDILFRTAAATLLETVADPRLLGAHIGFLAVLHTWGLS
jgi:hypothetical protein